MMWRMSAGRRRRLPQADGRRRRRRGAKCGASHRRLRAGAGHRLRRQDGGQNDGQDQHEGE